MSIEAMKQAMEAFKKIHEGCGFVKKDNLSKESNELATLVRKDCNFAMNALRQAIEQAEMVKKGTKAWADTPDGWVDDLRGGVEKIVPSDYTNSHQPVAKDRHEFVDWQGVAADQAMTIAMMTLASKREWVGLNLDEIDSFMPYCHSEFDLAEFRTFASEIEAKLKERNT